MKGGVLVEFKDVTKRFGDLRVMDNFNAQFFEGETHVVCGRSGAGKSTMLRCINWLEPINSGSILFEGISVNAKTAREVRKRVGMVFQHFNLFPHLTILRNAILGPVQALKESPREVIPRAKKLFDRVGLTDKIDAYPAQLSGGQKQRAAIVRALAMNPDLITFDEPTSALDPEMISEVLDVMKKLSQEGRSMIVVSHEMGFAKEAADRISFMDEGKLVETKSSNDFFENPEHDGTRQFLRQILQV